MNCEIIDSIKEKAIKSIPNECCGFVSVNKVGEVNVLECENRAFNKKDNFEISPMDFIKASKYGHVAAFYHSHFSDCKKDGVDRFSRQDIDTSNESCIPAFMYCVSTDTFDYLYPQSYEPVELLGRPFVRGIWDCHTLVRDYYKINRNIILTSYFFTKPPTDETDYGFKKALENEGAYEIKLSDIKENDILVFKNRSGKENHMGVYIGNGEYMHQPFRNLSKKSQITEKFAPLISRIFRIDD